MSTIPWTPMPSEDMLENTNRALGIPVAFRREIPATEFAFRKDMAGTIVERACSGSVRDRSWAHDMIKAALIRGRQKADMIIRLQIVIESYQEGFRQLKETTPRFPNLATQLEQQILELAEQRIAERDNEQSKAEQR